MTIQDGDAFVLNNLGAFGVVLRARPNRIDSFVMLCDGRGGTGYVDNAAIEYGKTLLEPLEVKFQ